MTAARQFPAYRARRPTQKGPDRPLTAAPIMLGAYHATVLAAEVLASSVHINILCPFRDNEVRLHLHALAYNLATLLRCIELPEAMATGR